MQNPRPDPVIVNVGHKRTLDLGVEVPSSELGPVASNEMWDEIYERIVQLVNAHRSTLVFVNTRRLAERIAHQLGERWAKRTWRRITEACRASCGWRRSAS
jgi:ATP-dependent helicase Lhr and Lhr-like helicase